MCEGSIFGNFIVDTEMWKKKLKSVLDGSYMETAFHSKKPWFNPKDSQGKEMKIDKEKGHYVYKKDWARNKKTGVM